MNRRAAVSLVLALLVAAIPAIGSARDHQSGIMAGDWTPPEGSETPKQMVTIAWEEKGPTFGDMTFTLGKGGERYRGSYQLIQRTKVGSNTQNLYSVWAQSDWVGAHATAAWFEPGWGFDTFVQHYDGRVVVGLQGDKGHSARCRFTLKDTEAGMPGGGNGACQITDGGSIDAHF